LEWYHSNGWLLYLYLTNQVVAHFPAFSGSNVRKQWLKTPHSWLILSAILSRQFYKVKYVRLPDLLDELAVARGEGIFKKVMKKYKKVNLLILDEWLLTSLKDHQARDLLEIVESRHQVASTIFCSQFDTPGWYEKIGEETLADAILDRIIHDSYNIFIDGERSMRERHGLKQ
jgi:DNA replication protein DnaC